MVVFDLDANIYADKSTQHNSLQSCVIRSTLYPEATDPSYIRIKDYR